MPRQHSRRRRRGLGGPLYRLLTTAVAIVCISAALTMFFRVRNLSVTGLRRYTVEQIQEAAGVEYGDNLFFLDKYAMKDEILRQLPYVESLRINRGYPDTLKIAVEECGHPMAVVQDGVTWLVSSTGKIVDRIEGEQEGDWGTITGCSLLSPRLGSRIALATEDVAMQDSLLALLSALDAAGMLDDTDAIHMEDGEAVRLDYQERFTVKLRYDADFLWKLRTLAAYLDSDRIQENMTGTFDMTKDDRNFFQQDVR